MPKMFLVALAMLFVGGLVLAFLRKKIEARERGGAAPAEEGALGPMPYRRRDYLLTIAERGFFGALEIAAERASRERGEPLRVFAKVRLADLVYLPKGTAGAQGWLNRVTSKHVDFVVCRAADLRPVAAVELDDSSHEQARRQTRDRFVESALEAAGLPLLRVRVAPPGRGYALEELARGLWQGDAGRTH